MNHGSLTGYSKHRCTCTKCREAWRDYQREYARERARGEQRTVAAAEVRRHLLYLIDSGLTQSAICRASGVDKHTVHSIVGGNSRRLRRSSAGPLMAVTTDALPLDAYAPAAIAEGMLCEIRRGAKWTNEDIEQRLRITQPERIAHQAHVRPKTMAKILCAYRLLARRGLVDGALLQEVGA